MVKKIIKTPTLGVNAKSYMWGKELLDIALYCEKIAVQNDITVTLNTPFLDIYRISQHCPHVIINAQGVDPIGACGKMGGIVPEALVEAGADVVIINHAARPMTLNEVVKTVKRCKELGLYTFVCADTIDEVKMIATLHPTGIICEETSHIGSGKTSDVSYIETTTKAIKEYDPNIMVMQGAGIKSADDIYRNISLGSESGGGASGVFCSGDPKKAIDNFLQGILRARKYFGSRIVWI